MTKPYKAKLKKRKKKIKHNKHNRRFIEYDSNNFIIAVYCKGCGDKIKGLNSRGQLFPYGNYTEITLEFDNNSAHVTPMCKKCVSGKTKEDLEALYIADLEQFDREEDIWPSDNDRIWDDIYFARIPQGIAKKEKV
ncbi:MAG: hypothetical protein V3U84_03670 [Thiotrichaceae bacterium]